MALEEGEEEKATYLATTAGSQASARHGRKEGGRGESEERTCLVDCAFTTGATGSTCHLCDCWM